MDSNRAMGLRFAGSISILITLFILTPCGSATVSVSGHYYNDYGEISEQISVLNANFEGKVTLLPYQGYNGFSGLPYSISSEGKGGSGNKYAYSKFSHDLSTKSASRTSGFKQDLESNLGVYSWKSEGRISDDGQSVDLSVGWNPINWNADHLKAYLNADSPPSTVSSSLQATGHGKNVEAESSLSVDPFIGTIVSTVWRQRVRLNPEENILSQYTGIISHPGYLTYPTSQNEESITASMTLSSNFGKIYVPNIDEFKDYPLTIGAMQNPENDKVYMEYILRTQQRWWAEN